MKEGRSHSLITTTMVNRKLFVPSITQITKGEPPTQAVGAQPEFSVSNIQPRTRGNMIKDALTQVAVDAAGNLINAGANRLVDEISGSGNSGRGKPPVNGGGGGKRTAALGQHSSGFALSLKPNPKIINLDTGIKPNTIGSELLVAEENVCSPLHMSSVVLQIPTDTSTKMNQYFMNQIVPDLQSRAQSNVNFFIDTTTIFSATNILTSLNAMMNALQVYLAYMSVLSYYTLPSNNNDGMTYLRQQFTPTMLEDLTNLGRRLADIPIPPNLLELCRYLAGNFTSGENIGSPIIKVWPHYLNGSTILDGTQISSALSAISTSTVVNVYNILRRCVPNWLPRVIYDVDPIATYDPNFLSLFANLPFIMYGAGVSPHPQVSTEDQAIAWNSFNNNLDGMAFGLTTTYNVTSSKWLPGLYLPAIGATPSVANANTRKSFYEVSGVKGYYAAKDYPFLLRSRPETYQSATATTSVSCHMFGSTRCLQVSSNALRETDNTILEFLMDLDSIAIDKKEMYNPYTRGVNNPQSGPKVNRSNPKSSRSKAKPKSKRAY